ncbi:MAG TPA: type IV pilus secretin PilQ [Candidatus Baltobacteraceae bacterium]|nr:type IV pilus secretin PilQ [Candidatus Baltobacteraceae bacterium]HTZ72366.1 type IV pilus secretin PilQ [Candidatus Aquilonibacter sp.]
MRMIWRGLGLSALVAASLAVSSGNLRAADQPVVHVKTVVKDGGVRLEAQATGPFDYTTYRPSSNLFVLDMSGVTAGDSAGAQMVPSDLVKSYRLVPYAEGDKSMVRLEVLLAQGLEPQVQKTDSQDLVLTVSRDSSATAPPAPVVVPAAATEAAPASPSLIRNVTISENGGKTQVTVTGSSPLDVHSMRLQNPDRLVLDFPSAHLATRVSRVPSDAEPVRDVRIAQFTPETSRVVVDMRQAATYDIQSVGNDVTITFASNSTSEPVITPASDVTTTQNLPPHNAPKFSRISDVPAPSVALPRQLTQRSAALASQDGGQIQPQGVAGAMAAAQSQGAAPSGVPEGNPAVVPASSAAPAGDSGMSFAGGQSAPPTSARYTGEPISVNLKDVDLADFFRLIHEISGLNVVVDPSVKGTLTIVLDNVPWDQALDIVLKNNDLDKQLDGNVLRIATRATLKAEAQEEADLAKAQAEATDVVTTTRVLSYAKATTVAATLKKFLSSRGDMLADDRTNTLIIRDIPSTFPVIDNLLRQLDRKSQQVEIEARVVAANRSFAREIGSILGASAGAYSGGSSNLISGDGNVGASPGYFGPCPPVFIGTSCTVPTPGSTPNLVQIPLLTNLGSTAPTSGISYMFQSANFALDAVINAAESKGVGKLLSQPKIITQNNEKGTAKQGTKIPVQTVVNNTVSVQFVDAVLELDVTPQITADGTVYMDVTVENDQIDNGIPRVQGIPAIDTQSVETKVTVNDGATVVLGGMYITNQQTQINDVPVVGSLPIIGNLFKHTQVSTTSQELFFFLTPRILPS